MAGRSRIERSGENSTHPMPATEPISETHSVGTIPIH
ncbi:MAG: hypothetical protein QOF58_5805, partial [Pseudonocardiales bacterium]|nr:hypothetical protein [Pseudonocardiales bacterium]